MFRQNRRMSFSQRHQLEKGVSISSSKHVFKLLLLGIIFWLCSDQILHPPLSIHATNNNITIWTKVTSEPSIIPKLKYILYYNSYWSHSDFQFGEGQEPFVEYGCPIHHCYATSNRSMLDTPSDFDAVLFHAHDKHLPRKVPWRNSQQYFVMMSMESPLYDLNTYRYYKGFFNATMTYRRDSDFPRPYGWFRSKQQAREQPEIYEWSLTSTPDSLSRQRDWIPYDEHRFFQSLSNRNESFLALADRPKQVAWVVSHCKTPSFREDYVKELQKYISVDVFGKCGKMPCEKRYRDGMSGSCTTAVQRDYKFYLGFENAFCQDYVTEKFFERVNDHVVIVLGQANYSHIAPPHSYINAMDFDSPKHLAHYLHQLDHNRSEYLSYFWWKDYYEVLGPSKAFFAPSMCRLCERLHQNDTQTLSHSYKDIGQWWRRDARCGKMMPAWRQKSPLIGASKSRSKAIMRKVGVRQIKKPKKLKS